MSLLCDLGIHKPDLKLILRKDNRLEALCDSCGCRIEKIRTGRWTVVPPIER